LNWELSSYFSSSYFMQTGTDDPLHQQPTYGRLDGRVTLDLPGRRWAIDLIGKNLTDHRIRNFSTNQPTALGSREIQFDEPFNLAVQVRFRW